MQFKRISVSPSVDILLTSWIWQLRRFFYLPTNYMSWFLPRTPSTVPCVQACLVNLQGSLFTATFHSWQKILCWSDRASFQALITLLHRSWAKQPKKVCLPQDKQFFLEKHSFFMTIMMMSQAITLTKGTKNGNIVEGGVLEGGVNWLIVCLHFALLLGRKNLFTLDVLECFCVYQLVAGWPNGRQWSRKSSKNFF